MNEGERAMPTERKSSSLEDEGSFAMSNLGFRQTESTWCWAVIEPVQPFRSPARADYASLL
jgi:hypothetical protein